MTATAHLVPLPDGRVLDLLVAGAAGAPLVVSIPGTPAGHDIGPEMEAAAVDAGLRIASIARPGYAGSTRFPGRTVADVVPDVLAVVDLLGAGRFAVMGQSGGGPHALACGALAAGGRCVAVASISGVGPWGVPGLDFLADMGEGNEVEFGAAQRGEQVLRDLLVPWREEMVSSGAAGTYAAMESVLSAPDRAVFTGELARRAHASVSLALRDGVDGWLDDDLAFIQEWGFAPADVQAPVFLWQGEQDLMVPPAHGHWLAAALPTCVARFLPEDGHLTIELNRPAEILADLAAALAATD